MRKFSILFISLFVLSTTYGQNIQKDKDIGEEANKKIIAEIGLYEHPAEFFLNDVGQKLVSHLDEKLFDYQFAILDMEVPNAMALPGGYVYFSRSILVLANSEDELAGVMGHEITHVHYQHSRKAKNRGLLTAILLLPGAVLGMITPNGEIVSAPFTATFNLINSGYSRSNEKEADHEGAILAARAGYDPYGLPLILHKISLDTKIETGKDEESTWFDTHPYTPKRVKQLDKQIPKIEVDEGNNISENQKDFLDKLEGICIGANPEVGKFQDGLFLHPVMNFTMTIPEGWSGMNSPTAVGFASPEKTSQLVFSLADTVLDPARFSEEFLKEYYKNYSDKPISDERFDLNGYPAQILSFEQYSNDKKIIASMLWLTRDGRTYQFVQIGEEKNANIIVETARSLHVMTLEERAAIYQTIVHIVQAKEGENLKELSERTGNKLGLDYTALINNLDVNAKLTADRWIKIGVNISY